MLFCVNDDGFYINLLILGYICREEKELIVKQFKQFMEFSKVVMNDKIIKVKVERER